MISPASTSYVHLVRVGCMGHFGRFTSVQQCQFARSSRVICRTGRGLEAGEVLQIDHRTAPETPLDGELLRRVTPEDELLLDRQLRYRDQAYEACTKLLQERGIQATLMDVEHLFDGQGLYFYFLGEVTPQIEAVTQELAEAYETKVQFRKFTEALTQGCGPECGTGNADGCGTGCSSCAVADACRSSK